MRSVISLHLPMDMDIVCSLAMIQEEDNDGMKQRGSSRPNSSSTRSQWKSGFASEKQKEHHKPKEGNARTDDKLNTQLAYRKSKGLCFKCGVKWGKNHACPLQVALHINEEMLSVLHIFDGQFLEDISTSDEGAGILAV